MSKNAPLESLEAVPAPVLNPLPASCMCAPDNTGDIIIIITDAGDDFTDVALAQSVTAHPIPLRPNARPAAPYRNPLAALFRYGIEHITLNRRRVAGTNAHTGHPMAASEPPRSPRCPSPSALPSIQTGTSFGSSSCGT